MTHRYFPGISQEKNSTIEKKNKKFSVVNNMFVRQYYTQRAFVCKAGGIRVSPSGGLSDFLQRRFEKPDIVDPGSSFAFYHQVEFYILGFLARL